MRCHRNATRLALMTLSVLLSLMSMAWSQPREETIYSNGPPRMDFDFLSLDPIKIGPLGAEPIKLHAEVINIGDSTDSYALFRAENLPSSWYSALCIEGFCFRPDLDTIPTALTLSPMEEDTLSVYIYPSVVEGGGSVTLTVRSHADPSITRSLQLVGITSGTDILVVDDDGEHNYERYYEDTLGDGITYGTWIRCCEGVTAEDLSHFSAVVWETGEALPTLTLADQSALSEYLDGGGHLFISGQDIGWSLCDPASPDYSQTSCDFYQNYLHATYESNTANDFTLSGIFGDPISHGLDIEITGGDGAGNQTSPSVISLIDPAKEVFTYDDSQSGAVRVETGTYKVVYFAFGFEAINSENMRQEIMKNILNRFTYDGEKGDVDNNGVLNVIDLIKTVNIILGIIDPTPNEYWQADFNNNGTVNVLDLIDMVNAILG